MRNKRKKKKEYILSTLDGSPAVISVALLCNNNFIMGRNDKFFKLNTF